MSHPIPQPPPAPAAGEAPPASPVPPVPTPPSSSGTPALRPEGVSEAEWSALGDPGKAAIVRERARATAAEQALAVARTPPAPPKPAPAPKAGETADLGEQIRAAVEAAIAPLAQREAQREASQAAEKVRDAVSTAAGFRFHDATDALTQVDLASLTDGEGRADPQKITAALDDLLTRKPHLGKAVDDRRRAAPGSPIGAAGGSAAPLDDRVKATLARMQAAGGVKFADA